MVRCIVFSWLALCVAGCAVRAPDVVPERPSPEPVASDRGLPADAASDRGAESAARERYGQVRVLSDQTQALTGRAPAAEALAAAARALDERRWAAAASASEQAAAAAEAAISDHYARQANAELARAYEHTGLSDAQVLQLRAAEEILVTGNSRLAYGRLRMLNEQLTKRLKTYVVETGDSLWVIAGRPETYANPHLWPLVWQSNLAVIPNPNRLRRGQVLQIRPHPSVEEVAQAVDYARGKRKRAVTPQIGPIRRADP